MHLCQTICSKLSFTYSSTCKRCHWASSEMELTPKRILKQTLLVWKHSFVSFFFDLVYSLNLRWLLMMIFIERNHFLKGEILFSLDKNANVEHVIIKRGPLSARARVCVCVTTIRAWHQWVLSRSCENLQKSKLFRSHFSFFAYLFIRSVAALNSVTCWYIRCHTYPSLDTAHSCTRWKEFPLVVSQWAMKIEKTAVNKHDMNDVMIASTVQMFSNFQRNLHVISFEAIFIFIFPSLSPTFLHALV